MELFLKLFGKFITLIYSCFDRVLINGYIDIFHNQNTVAYFFKNITTAHSISKEAFSKRTNVYQKWVESFMINNNIFNKWAEKDERKEDTVKPYLQKAIRLWRKKGQYGVYFIFKSMETGNTFRSILPKYKNADENYRFIRKARKRFTHFYFYIFDPVLGNMSMRVATYFPFHTAYWINGHNFIEQELIKNNVSFKKNDNAFLKVDELSALKTASDNLTSEIIRQRFNYWTFVLGPKFSEHERQSCNLNYSYYIQQIEYCINFIFKKNFYIHNLFQKASQLGLISFLSDKISNIFGYRISPRHKGKFSNHFDSFEHSHHNFKICFKKSFAKQYQKLLAFLRNEISSYNLKEFGINKALDNLPLIKEKFTALLDRFTSSQAQLFNIHFDHDIFPNLAKPVLRGKTKIAGIKIQDDRMLRLMEILLRSNAKIQPFASAEIYNHLLKFFRLSETDYSITQFRYDLRKLIAHDIVERINSSYSYRLTDFGLKVIINFVIFRKNIYGPVLNSQFNYQPDIKHAFNSKLEKAYYKIDKDIGCLYKLLAA